jgi:hypothetical protein
VKDDNGNLLADSHNHFSKLKKYFSHLLNMHNVSDVRQIEVHTAEPLVSDPSFLEFEIAIAKLNKYKSPGGDQIPGELIQTGDEILVQFGLWNNCLMSGRGLISHEFTKRMIKLTRIIIMRYRSTAINFIYFVFDYPPLKGNFIHGCHMVSVTEPYCRILGFLDQSHYFFS